MTSLDSILKSRDITLPTRSIWSRLWFFQSVQFGRSVVSDSLWPHGLQHCKPPCPSPTPRIYSNSCPLSQWCHPTISSSVIPFSSHLQSFPASESFQMSQFSHQFSSSHIWMWELDYKESWVLKNWCFWTVVLEKTLESPLDCRRSNQSILKKISPEYSLEGLMLKLKLQYFGHLMGRADSLEKTLMLGKIEGRRRRGWQRMRWLDGITTQ